MTTRIYFLCTPNGEPRYVGKTIYTLANRLTRHIKETRKGNYYRAYWIRQQIRAGSAIEIHLIEEVDGDGSAQEIFWIAEYRRRGYALVNCTDGGEGILGFKFSAASRKKMSDAHRRRSLSEKERLRRAEQARVNWRAKTAEERAAWSSHLTLVKLAKRMEFGPPAPIVPKAPAKKPCVKKVMTAEQRAAHADYERERRVELKRQLIGPPVPPELLHKARSSRVKLQWQNRTQEERASVALAISKRRKERYERRTNGVTAPAQ